MEKPEQIPEGKIGSIGQQLRYPLDYTTQQILREFSRGEAFPVGSIYISVVSTDPSSLLGYGTWVAFATGRTLVGIDTGQSEFDSVEETGGAKTHTLTVNEMPSHTHSVAFSSGSTGNFSNGNVTQSGGNTGATGGDQPHNNLQPYIVVYMWKRTA
jgi:hypothetical protein